jgi:hypothetical protein
MRLKAAFTAMSGLAQRMPITQPVGQRRRVMSATMQALIFEMRYQEHSARLAFNDEFASALLQTDD